MKDTTREMIAHIENSPFFIGERGIELDENSFLTNIPIDEIKFNTRFYHVISGSNFKYLTDVLNTNYNKILIFRNCGIKSISNAQKEIRNFIISEVYDITKSLTKNSEDKNECMEINESVVGLLSSEEKNKFDEISDLLLRKLPISTRLKRFLADNPHIKTIKDISEISPNIFKKTKNLGRKTYLDTKEMILNLLKKDAKELVHNYSDKKMPILDLIDLSLKELSPRDMGIVIKRWGDKEINSLQIVADEYEITRERIRQIIDRVIKQIKSKIQTHIEFYRKQFLSMILIHPEAIAFERLEDYPLIKREYDKKVYLGILAEIFEEVPFEGFMPKSFEQLNKRKIVSNQKWRKIVDRLDSLPLFIGEMTPQNLVNNLSSNGFNISDQLLCFKIILGTKKYFFFKDETKFFLLRRGGIREIFYTILGSSKAPLGIEEIVCTFRKYYYYGSKYDNINAIMSNIKQDDRIIQFDRYKFGIEKHFAYDRNEWFSINSLAKKYLSEIKRQSYVTEILQKIVFEFPQIMSKYELVYILRTDPEIRDLGFFNFTLMSFNQEERMKVNELLKEIYNKDPGVKHFREISTRLKEHRFIRDEGVGCILRNQDFLKDYPGGFYGLRKLDNDNWVELSKKGMFINYLVSHYFFPNTEINAILNFFDSESLRQNAMNAILSSNVLSIYSPEVECEIIINRNWSTVKIIECLLYNSNEPVFEEQLSWMLKDLQKSLDKSDLYKIRNNSTINYFDGRYSIIKKELHTKELISILDDCYNFISDSEKSLSLDEIYELAKNYLYEDIDFYEFGSAVKEDERFIVTDNNLVFIR